MPFRLTNPAGVAPPIGTYSHAATVTGGSLLFISGQGPLDESGALVGEGDLIRQAEQVFENIRRILAASGATFQDVAKLNIYVTDFSRRQELGALRARLFGSHAPVSTAVQVSRLAIAEWLIEVECVAVLRSAI